MKTTLSLILVSLFSCALIFGQEVHPKLMQSAPVHCPLMANMDAKSVLYEQLASPSSEVPIPSQMFSDFPTYTCQAADDFFVPEGLPWQIESLFLLGSFSDNGGPVGYANVYIYEDAGNMPGSAVTEFFQINLTSAIEGNLDIILPELVTLPTGHYWLSVQPVMVYTFSGQWYWNRQMQPTYGTGFHWQNPGGGFCFQGTQSWQPGSTIPWPGSNEDLNLGFAIYGEVESPPPLIVQLSDNSPYFGQNIRIYGEGFGDLIAGSAIEINGVQYTNEITYWSENEIFFNLPDLGGISIATLRVFAQLTGHSNPVEITIFEPSEVYFLSLKENDVLSGEGIFVSVAAEIDQDLISLVRFQYQPEGLTNWINFGIDVNGTAQHYSTYYPIGAGNGWGKWWNYSGLADNQTVGIRVIMTTIFGQQLSGEISVVIDRTPLAPVFRHEGSKLNGSIAALNDSLVFNIEAKDEDTQAIEFNWQAFAGPSPGWWDVERDLDLINQNEVVFLDDNGDTVSYMACGPSAMASCLKWLAQQYPGSDIGLMSIDSLAKKLAQDAGTDSSGTTSANLTKAVEHALNSDEGISDDFEITTTYNSTGISKADGNYHNVSNDIAAGLRDSSDVVMLIYQKTESGDTLGHYVTANSFRSQIHYEWNNNIETTVQTSWIDFMDPATGLNTEKQIGWSSNPPTIEDYDLNPETSSGTAWVHSVTAIKPKNDKGNINTLITSFPVNGAGNYTFKLACDDLPEGNNMLGIFGVDNLDRKAMDSYIRCVNGKYETVSYFTADRDISITDYPVNFTDLSLHPDSVNWWKWDFGDGSDFSLEQNPGHTYTQMGTFDVSLIVSDGNNFDTITRPNFINIVEAVEQQFSRQAGWSGVSGFVDPAWTNIEYILGEAFDDLVIMQNFYGVLWPSEDINTLENWDTGTGYKVKFDAPVTFHLKGFSEADGTISLNAGWSILPVVSECNVLTVEVQGQLGGTLEVIKEIAGNLVFWPEYGITTLGQLIPGSAYMLLLSEGATLTFPQCEKFASENSLTLPLLDSPWGRVEISPNSHLMCIMAGAISSFNKGDVIGAFDVGGRCIGTADIVDPKQNISLMVFGDDPAQVASDRVIEGQNLTFKVFISRHNETAGLFPEFDLSLPDAGTFKTDGLSVIKRFYLASSITQSILNQSISIFPNPATGLVQIQGVGVITAVTIYNALGERIMRTTVNGDAELDLQTLQKGIYLVQVMNEHGVHFEKLILK
jgi:PKD repeat protein